MTRRVVQWIAGIVLVLLALPVLAVILVLTVANVGPGRHLIERQVASLTGGMVRIDGLGGRFPDALKASRVEISDAQGPYLIILGLSFDWSPMKLLQRDAVINGITAARIDFSRLPVAKGQSTSSSGTFKLPVRVEVRDLQVYHAVIEAAVAGVPASLAISGSADLPSLTEGTVRLDARRLDSPGHYAIDGTVTADAIRAAVQADEPVKGLIAQIAHLPNLGAMSIQGSVDGPMNRVATRLAITAGPLTASASGTVDVPHQAADLAVQARSSAMAPAVGVSWQAILLDAAVHGPFVRPDASGTIKINALNAGGARIGSLNADITGTAGKVQLHANAEDLHISGPKPDLFAGDPVTLDASTQLDAADRPVAFKLRHSLVSADGTARTAGVQQLQAHLTLPDLAPLAAAGGVDIRGSSDLDVQAEAKDGTTTAAVKGRLGITGGSAPIPALLGDSGSVDLAASMRGQDIRLSHLAVVGKVLSVSAAGGMSDQTIKLDWSVAVAELAGLQPDLAGRIDASGHAEGKLDDLGIHADIGADVATKGYSSGHITVRVDAAGLPGAPHASVSATGTLLDAPLSLSLTAGKTADTVNVDITQASWKSLQAGGTASLTPPAVIPVGNLHVDLERLADLEPLVGRPLAGQASATLASDPNRARIGITVKDVVLPGTAAVNKAALNVTVDDPAEHPAVEGSLTAEGVSAGSAKAVSARLTAKGPIGALDIALAADAPAIAGSAARLTAAGTFDGQARTLALARMEASWKQQVLKLLVPARFSFADGVAMDRVRLGFRQAELTVSGSAGTALDLTATLRNLSADVAAIADPSLAADGVIAADVRISGTSARPEGTIKLTADRVRLRQGPGQGLPTASMVTNIALLGTAARVDTKLVAGPSHVSVAGTVPLSQGGALNLKTDGRVDLAMLDPLLLAQGRRVRGEVSLDASVAGSTAAPSVRGTAQLRDGDVTDYVLGAHVSDLNATIQAAGDTIRIASLSAKAGPGTLSGSGSVGLAGAMPVDLHLTASNARPLASDLLSALIDANLTVQGDVKGEFAAGGTLHVRRAVIQIPDRMPPSIAVLPVRDAGAPPPPLAEAGSQSTIALNLTIDAPQQVFIRGRGLDAELGGTIHIRGTSAKPAPDGGLHLRRGTLTVVGTTLNFTEGTIDFSGGGISDPTVHFVATSSTTTIVTTLTVSGSAKDPKITLSSVPDMPQDEILAQLLFGTSTSKLSPLQLAEIAAALAQMSGATSSFDPLGRLRSTFGLDRLSVGSSSSGSPTLEAGRYLTRGVYLGAKQSASGSGTQATVQVDIAKGLKLETTAGSGLSSATGSTSSADAASVGLTYQFEY